MCSVTLLAFPSVVGAEMTCRHLAAGELLSNEQRGTLVLLGTRLPGGVQCSEIQKIMSTVIHLFKITHDIANHAS